MMSRDPHFGAELPAIFGDRWPRASRDFDGIAADDGQSETFSAESHENRGAVALEGDFRFEAA